MLDQLLGVLEPFEQPALWPALREIWARYDTPQDNTSRRLAELDRQDQQARHELAEAARLLVGGADRVVYEALRDEHLKTREAIKTERERLQGLAHGPHTTKLPPLDHVLRQAGS